MGMFDDPEPFTDHFKEGEPFTLEAAKVGNVLSTIHGDAAPVLLRVDGKWYSIFGQGLTNQVERMERGDLPAVVRIERVETKNGNQVKLLVPANRPTPDADDIPF